MSKNGETISFTYNEDGLRVQKTSTSTGTTKYTLHGKNIVHLVNGSNDMHFFYDAQNKPAVVSFNGALYAYLYNLQGDVIALVDVNGSKVVEYMYDAWGRLMSKTGSLASTLGTIQPFRYRGYIYDEEVGMYCLHHRYYRPNLHRFISADSDKSAYFKSAYAYCSNNPANFFDPTGLAEENFSNIDNRQNISNEYYAFLQTIYDYSRRMYNQSELVSDKPSVYTTTKVMENCVWFAKQNYPYRRYDCAYSIAMQLPRCATSTGMTKMWNRDAVATISIEAAGGYSNLLEGMILVCYDVDRDKPAHHGGIYANQSPVYESSPSTNGFRKNTILLQPWNKVMWVDGMILSPVQMKIVESILFLVRDKE